MMENKYINNFFEIYSKDIGEDATKTIIEKSDNIINELFENGKTINATGILVGKVQSGKTSNFLGVISAAFDRGFDVAFVIGGKDKDLLKQNHDRLTEVFERINKDSLTIDCMINTSSNLDHSTINKKLKRGSKLVVSVLKNSKHFDKIFNLIYLNEDAFQDKKILFIDDEGDQGTLDGNALKEAAEVTAWNKKITEIRNICNNYAFLTVTATPQANFLIDQSDMLSPKFIKTSEPGKGYMGLEYFHNTGDKNNVIEIIDDDEVGCYADDNFAFEDDIPKDLKRSISYYLNSITYLYLEGNKEVKNMLVHIERKVNDQKEIYSSINNFIDFMIECSEKQENDFNKQPYIDFLNLGFRMINYRDINLNNDSDKEFYKNFSTTLENVGIFMINNPSKQMNDGQLKQYLHRIIIGADLVERGITLKNLVTTYITRNAKGMNNADTILQRARWFGYRKNIEKYVKVFLSRKLKIFYNQLYKMEQDLWDNLTLLEKGFYSTYDFIENIFISLDPEMKLRATRANVAKTTTINYTQNSRQKKFFEPRWDEDSYIESILDKKDYEIEVMGGRSMKTKIYKNLEEFDSKSKILSIIYNNVNLDRKVLEKVENIDKYKVKVIFFSKDNSFSDFNEKTKFERSVDDDGEFMIFGSGAKAGTDFNNQNEWFGERNLHLYEVNKNMIIIQMHDFKFLFNDSEPQYGYAYSIFCPRMSVKGYKRGI